MNRLYDKMLQYGIELEVKPLGDEWGHRYAMFTFTTDRSAMISHSTAAIINMDDVVLEGNVVIDYLNMHLDGLIKVIEEDAKMRGECC